MRSESPDFASRCTDEVPASSAETGEAATFIFERQAKLDRMLAPSNEASLATLLLGHPPLPAVLLAIQSSPVRDRYAQLLHKANIRVELVDHRREALSKLEARNYAVLLTDQLDLIRGVRALATGSVTHIVFVTGSADSANSALDAGANDVMPERTENTHFWAQLYNTRRIVSFAASLNTAITDNRILSAMDELTQCGNRRFFDQQFPRELARASRLRRNLSLVLADIDLFKEINDRYGHPEGDEVLRQFGDRLTRSLRFGEDWVARYGGEEFAVVLPETAELQACAIAERLRESIAVAPFQTEAGPIAVTASFGVCGVAVDPASTKELNAQMVRAADAALYASKRAGRNCVKSAAIEKSTP
jgi:two-component system, cell cycle response regulator